MVEVKVWRVSSSDIYCSDLAADLLFFERPRKIGARDGPGVVEPSSPSRVPNPLTERTRSTGSHQWIADGNGGGFACSLNRLNKNDVAKMHSSEQAKPQLAPQRSYAGLPQFMQFMHVRIKCPICPATRLEQSAAPPACQKICFPAMTQTRFVCTSASA